MSRKIGLVAAIVAGTLLVGAASAMGFALGFSRLSPQIATRPAKAATRQGSTPLDAAGQAAKAVESTLEPVSEDEAKGLPRLKLNGANSFTQDSETGQLVPVRFEGYFRLVPGKGPLSPFGYDSNANPVVLALWVRGGTAPQYLGIMTAPSPIAHGYSLQLPVTLADGQTAIWTEMDHLHLVLGYHGLPNWVVYEGRLLFRFGGREYILFGSNLSLVEAADIAQYWIAQ